MQFLNQFVLTWLVIIAELEHIQCVLMDLCSSVATPDRSRLPSVGPIEKRKKHVFIYIPGHVAGIRPDRCRAAVCKLSDDAKSTDRHRQLELTIDTVDARLPRLTSFILPGGGAARLVWSELGDMLTCVAVRSTLRVPCAVGLSGPLSMWSVGWWDVSVGVEILVVVGCYCCLDYG
jgi:hypothetical protein